MKPRSIDCEADALTTTPSRRLILPSLSILPSSTFSRTSTDSKYFMWRLEKWRSFNSVALTFRYPRLKLIIISASKFYRPSSSKHARIYTALQRFRSHVESVNWPKIAVILPPESANSDQDQKTFLICCKKRILYLNQLAALKSITLKPARMKMKSKCKSCRQNVRR